jgi:hypothetical protein
MRTVAFFPLYVAAVVFGTYQTFRPTFDSGFAQVQSERGDGMLNHYILEHSWQVLTNAAYPGSLFSPPFFFPQPYTLWYSEHLLGVAPAYWALRLVLPEDLAYQWWQISLNSLNFVAFAVVMRWLGGPRLLALLGGYLWAFALVQIDQIKHQQMIPRFWMPLAAYYAWSWALAPSSRSLNRMLLFMVLQCLTCVYTGWFLATGLATFLPLAIGLRASGWADVVQFWKQNTRRVIAILAGWGAVLLAVFIPYLVVNWGVARTYGECVGLMPTRSAWLTGLPGTPWYEVTVFVRNPVEGECQLFCGMGLYALMLAAALHLRITRGVPRPPEFALMAAGLLTAIIWVLFTLTWWPDRAGLSLWQLVRFIPGATAIRCVSRVYVTVYLFGPLAALLWLSAVTARLRLLPRQVVLTLITAFILYEQTGYCPPSFNKRDFYPIVDRTANQLRGSDAGYVLPEYHDTTGKKLPYVYGEVLAMWAGLRAGVPVVNGYSGRWPPGNYPESTPATDNELRAWLAGRFRGKLAIVDPDRPDATRVIVID